MIPIFEEKASGQTGYSFDEFERRFFEICANHRETGRAKLFAFILYDFGSPHILKLLRDADYWRALDVISGHYVTVFSLHVNEPRASSLTEARMMVQVGPISDPGYKTQLILRSYFGLRDSTRLPAVMFFQTVDREVSGYCLAQVEDGTVEETFVRVRELIRVAAETTKAQMLRGNHQPGQIYDAVAGEIRRRHLKAEVWKGLKAIKSIAEIVGLIKMVP